MRKLKRRAVVNDLDDSLLINFNIDRLLPSTSTDQDRSDSPYRPLKSSRISELDSETISDALGDVAGLNVLCVAYGNSTRSSHLPQSSVGEDLAAAFVEFDRQLSDRPPFKARFAVAHSTLPLTLIEEGTFDLIFGARFCISEHHLLPPYTTVLIRFRSIRKGLRPGGRFLGICHHFIGDSGGQRYQAHESIIHHRIRKLVEAAAEEAGLERIRWIPRHLSDGQENLELQGDFVLLECLKSRT